ncbi:MAG: PepSY domain-containing protein [Ruminococcus sp.]|nr:PepSY domain-containing protein [Ruminococcus sp.]
MKKLFSTPKRAVISTICITAVVLTAAAAIPAVVLNNTLIGKAEAEKAALRDAGLSASDVSSCRTELDFEDGHFRYEVDFYSGGVEYEYQLLAKDGEIISRDIDGDSSAKTSMSGENSDKTSKKDSASADNGSSKSKTSEREEEAVQTSEITLDEAKAAALADAGLTESEVSFTKTQLGKDDSVSVYDIEFYTSDAEYDYEINAADGTVREWKTNAFQSAVISMEEAKAAALADAGLTEADVTFTKTNLSREDSAEVYDIEFYTADTEYDYEINGADGTVRERNADTFLIQNDSDYLSSEESDKYIGIDRAKEIAVEHAGLNAADVQFFKAKLENDDGRSEYEIEFYHGDTEYDYSIGAVSGEILEFNSERD